MNQRGRQSSEQAPRLLPCQDRFRFFRFLLDKSFEGIDCFSALALRGGSSEGIALAGVVADRSSELDRMRAGDRIPDPRRPSACGEIAQEFLSSCDSEIGPVAAASQETS